MKEILFKSFVYPFYKAYLGFFILATLILGIFMELKQHLMIAERILQTSSWFATLIFCFIAYSFLQLRFQIKLLQSPEYRVFQKLSFLSYWDFLKHFFSIWLANHAMIFLYFVLLTFVGLKIGAWEKVFAAWFSLLFLGFGSNYFSYQTLQKFYPEMRIHRNRITFLKPYFSWFLAHLKENRPLLILTVKATSLFILSGFFYSYYSGGYDARWLAFGLLVSAYLHYPLWMEKVDFGERQLSIFRNLPLAFKDKFIRELQTLMSLIIPELLLILYQGRGIQNKTEQVSLLCFWIGIHLGIYSMCMYSKNKLNPNFAFFGFFLVFLSLLFGVNPIFLSGLFLLLFSYLISSSYQL